MLILKYSVFGLSQAKVCQININISRIF